MEFSSPYLVVVNKCEDMQDKTALPYGSVAISAKTGLGIPELKREILNRFKRDFYFCDLFIPYSETSNYAKIKQYVIERNVQFTDDGQTVSAVISAPYADYFTKYIVNRY
jgi:50S ribosomal subunit-associated GTPase HflX